MAGDDADDSDLPADDLDRPLHEVLGTEPHFAPDDLSPPVDEGRLVAFVREQLPLAEREEVLNLIASFRPWLRAWADLLRRHAKGGNVHS